MKPAVTFKWADEQHATPVERGLAARMIVGNRRLARQRRAGVCVIHNHSEHRTVIVAAGAVATIERSTT